MRWHHLINNIEPKNYPRTEKNMSINIEVFPDLGIVLTVVTGVINDRIGIDSARQLAEKPGFDASFDHILDLAGTTANNLTREGIQEIARITPFSSTSRRVFIVSESDLGAQADFFSGLLEVDPDKVFVTHSREKAYRWLLE
jgi:hypothetical protein